MKHTVIVIRLMVFTALFVFSACANPFIDKSSESKDNNENNQIPEETTAFGTLADFPEFYFLQYVIDPVSNPTVPEILYHNPSSEYDFPSILDTESIPALSANTYGRYFLYYSPHNDVGGINVAFANNPEGPWEDYEFNPVIPKDVLPETQMHNGMEYKYLNTTSSMEHVSTGHPIWNEQENKLFMYFHGYGNHATHFSTSDDGLNFVYQKIAVGDRDLDLDSDEDGTPDTQQVNEASNARVFKYCIPGKTNNYIMMFMGATVGTNRSRNIYLAWSDNGYEWSVQKDPLIPASIVADGEFTNLSAATLVEKDDRLYVTVQASSALGSTRVHAHLLELKKDLSAVHYHGIAYESSEIGQAPDYGRVGGRSYIKSNDIWYMFYEAGQRGSTRIALARTWTEAQLQEISSLVIEGGVPAITVGQGNPFSISYEVFRRNGSTVSDLSQTHIEYVVEKPDIVQLVDGQLFANATGSTEITITLSLEDVSIQSSIIVEVIDGEPWAFVDDRFELDYSSYWNIAQGSSADSVNSILQNLDDGFISMSKTHDTTQDPDIYNFTYRYLTKTFLAQTEAGVTFETRAKVSELVESTGAEFTVRANNKQYKLYLAWDPVSQTGFVKDGITGTIQSFELDTTKYHIYRVIVAEDGLEYSIYVDGIKVLDCEYKSGTGSNLVKLGFDTSARGNVNIDYFKLKWGIELP